MARQQTACRSKAGPAFDLNQGAEDGFRPTYAMAWHDWEFILLLGGSLALAAGAIGLMLFAI